MNEQWIKQIRQKMADYKQPAPEVSWEAIDKAMTVSKPNKVIPFNYWMRGIAAAVVLLLITGISIRLLNRPEDTPVQQAIPVNNDQITTAGEDQLQPQLTDSPTQEPQPTFMAETTTSPSNKSKEKSTPVVSESETLADNIDTSVELNNNVADETPVQETKQEYTEPERRTKTFFDVPDVVIPRNKKRKSDRLMAQAYVSNAMSGSSQSESFRQLQYKETIKPNGSLGSDLDFQNIPSYQNDPTDPNNPVNPNYPTNPYNSIDPQNPIVYDTIITVNTIQTERNIRHHQPIKIGFSLRYQLSDRLSMTSGLLYTLLASDITTNVNGITNHYEQKLHYLGIPLNIGYELWTDCKLGLYVSAGGTAEKQLNGPDWQFSLNGSVGVDYKLSNRFSLYAEPGVGYYIPNNSNLSTIYKDNPWNFNLTIGLRFHLR